MHQRIIANTSTFVMFDLQEAKNSQHMTVTSDFLILSVQTDEFILHLGNDKKVLQAQQMLLLAPFTPFRLSTSYSEVDFANCKILYFRLNLLGKQLVDSVQFSTVKKMLVQAERGLIFTPASLIRVEPYLKKIKNTYEFEQIIHLLSLLNELAKIVDNEYLMQQAFIVTNQRKSAKKIQTILHYIEDNLAKPLAAEMLAKKISMGKSTFSRFFHKHLGVTFRQYLIEKRIQQAAEYLILTDLSITQISLEVGFSSLSNFNSKFKSLLRSTPRHYRAHHVMTRQARGCELTITGQIRNQMQLGY